VSSEKGIDRRQFLGELLKGGTTAVAGGVVWGGLVLETKGAPLALRPPGALPEQTFLSRCIKCGLCVEACPYDTLSLATPGSGVPVGTPEFKPRSIPCYMCQDIPCTVDCPTGALDLALVSSDDGRSLDVNRSRMGLAVMDYHNCIAAWGLRCDACYRACPLIDQAITLEHSRNERTGRHAILLPKVQTDVCTGCGLCERACIVEEAAIKVLPREVVLGKVGDNYLRGWDQDDQRRINNAIPPDDVRQEQATDPLDYLNDGDLNDE
jgi:ferredoxin-type protein NapG